MNGVGREKNGKRVNLVFIARDGDSIPRSTPPVGLCGPGESFSSGKKATVCFSPCNCKLGRLN